MFSKINLPTLQAIKITLYVSRATICPRPQEKLLHNYQETLTSNLKHIQYDVSPNQRKKTTWAMVLLQAGSIFCNFVLNYCLDPKRAVCVFLVLVWRSDVRTRVHPLYS